MTQQILSLKPNSPQIHSLLLFGSLEKEGRKWLALPREVIRNQGTNIDSVVFEIIQEEDITRPPFGRVLWRAIRPDSLTSSLSPLFAVYLLGLRWGWQSSPLSMVFSFLAVASLHIAMNTLNDVDDHIHLIDLPGSLKGSGVLQRGWLTAHALRAIGYGALLIGLSCGIPVAFQNPVPLLSIGSVALVGLFAYTHRTIRSRYPFLGDLLFFLLTGPLLSAGFSQAAFGIIDLSVVLLGCFFGFLSWPIFFSKQVQDMELDFRHQIPSTALNLGFKNARHFLSLLYGLSYSAILLGISLGEFPVHVIFSLGIGLMVLFPFIKELYQASGPVSARLGSIRIHTARIHFFIGTWVSFMLLLWKMFNRAE